MAQEQDEVPTRRRRRLGPSVSNVTSIQQEHAWTSLCVAVAFSVSVVSVIGGLVWFAVVSNNNGAHTKEKRYDVCRDVQRENIDFSEEQMLVCLHGVDALDPRPR